jgi:outer membrane receptor protein involved in Fe transport
MGLKGANNGLNFGLNFTSLKATYQTSESIVSSLNPQADAQGHINISPGNAIPLMPSHLLNARVGYAFSSNFKSGLSLSAVDSSFMRGNENNLPTAKVPGYAVFHWNGSLKLNEDVVLFANISNLFDKKFSTSGAIGSNAFSSSGAYTNANLGTLYQAPGAPRMLNLHMRMELH